ncbi:hypothetical protein VMF7928_00788 [Vibrio marisflavi CECT 7928]|uniref:FAD dependent oxidoreductase domain-containing protein n=2 Tax=Vibrio marisflavi TaxID=1216040 RepID=A0ABM9A1H8_9VIBR|nr:hypothetical protein VMF7928_00788 [Vibrio marisflavi CECT 7928]
MHLAELGVNVTLLEKGTSLVAGPPICHLHAGGNLYREISETQCVDLLKQSIDTARFYPHTLNIRPTLIAVPKQDAGTTESLVARLRVVTAAYMDLVNQDPNNKVLGEPQDYYRLYTKSDLERLASREQPSRPNETDEWVIPFAQNVDLESIKYPVIAVQEYGWSLFRVAASVSLTLENYANCQVHLNSKLENVTKNEQGWRLEYREPSGEMGFMYADYLINACGFQTGEIDDLVSHRSDRLVEFKAAYVTQWPDCQQKWPEVIFHGVRGTKNGMAQLTPYPNGVFQLHGMTEEITLFSDGLVSSCEKSSQPTLPQRFRKKIDKGWSNDVIDVRTNKAIQHLSQFIPSYISAQRLSKPLYGAQQIPGDNVTLRSADVSFADHNYARIEVVKGSSAIEAARKIIQHWNLVRTSAESIKLSQSVTMSLTEAQVEQLAIELAEQRGYPIQLAEVFNKHE